MISYEYGPIEISFLAFLSLILATSVISLILIIIKYIRDNRRK